MFPAVIPFNLWLPSMKSAMNRGATRQAAMIQFMKELDPTCMSAYKYSPTGRHSLYKDDVSEVALWRWEPEQILPMHPHTGKLCVWRVMNGRITEYRPKQRDADYFKGDVGYIEDGGMHSVENMSPENEEGMTLHFYVAIDQL